MNFKTFQKNCKHAKYGLKEDAVREFELTCRLPGHVRQGYSWEVCDEQHCPHFRCKTAKKCANLVARDMRTGEVLFTFSEAEFTAN